ncbi:hypothetical protein JJE66_29625 [Bradyrhizobium diazoefficiens]|uniref:hypothetical protein n=1 Tax=Bradyrhizobium diazoefficiens TaxID=1355477 RepID=UPI00190A5C23|nr:hypothetical protein [Bradyrhizobium diazoefficiens]MBK3665380.1 hypothetical protein [Bradyrhizobium diazoefficiens]
MKSNAPRRYVVDEMGRHVLIGLTYEEMLELQRVDSRQTGQPRGRPDAANRNDPGMAHDELSWQELYSKHDRSWKLWVAASRIERCNRFDLLDYDEMSESNRRACSVPFANSCHDVKDSP